MGMLSTMMRKYILGLSKETGLMGAQPIDIIDLNCKLFMDEGELFEDPSKYSQLFES